MSVDVSTVSPHSYMQSHIISSPRESRYRCARLFFFRCQLGYFSIHSTNAFTQATEIKVTNSFKGQPPVERIQVGALTSWSRMSNSLLVELKCTMTSNLWSFPSPMHVSSWNCDEMRMTALFLADTYDINVRSLVELNREDLTSLCFPLRNNAGISGSFSFGVNPGSCF